VQTVDRTVVVRRLDPSDWLQFREIRLRALAESPAAFGSTLEEASQLDQAGWRDRLAGRAQFVAMRGSAALGTAAGIAAGPGGGAELISMWVDPSWRGHGVADELVIARRSVRLVAGASGRQKLVVVEGIEAEEIVARWPGLRV